MPGVTLRTTFIVGHPGETEAAFQRLCDFVREAELDRVGVFNFSREEGTVAALLPKRVPPKEIDARRRELLRIQRDISKKKLRALRGRELEVLVEGPSDESEYLLMGRHEGQAPEIDGQVYLSLPGGAAGGIAGEADGGLEGAEGEASPGTHGWGQVAQCLRGWASGNESCVTDCWKRNENCRSPVRTWSQTYRARRSMGTYTCPATPCPG